MIEYEAERGDVFAITYDRFEGLAAGGLGSLGTEYHLRNIIALGLLGFLLEFQVRGLKAGAFTSAEREQVERLCQKYLAQISHLDALDSLKSLRTLSSAARDFLQKWTGPVTALISVVLASHGVRGLVPTTAPTGQATDAVGGPSKAHFEALIRLVKSVGFRSIYVLIDKVDETAETGNNAEASFLLVKPLLRDLELLQLKGAGFKFFLWDKIEPSYRAYARPDRLQQFALSWSRDEMNQMLSRRLAAFSGGAVRDLGQLATGTLGKTLQVVAIMFASGSPRDMIRVCQVILSEQLQLDPNSERIDIVAIERGLSAFSEQRTSELLPTQVIQDLRKIGRADFTTSYVASEVFKIEANSARNKIEKWTKTGLVEKVGELHPGTRPVYQYALTDIRVAKAVFRHLDLVDFLHKINGCPHCQILLIRDWEREPTHSCHSCGKAVKGRAQSSRPDDEPNPRPQS